MPSPGSPPKVNSADSQHDIGRLKLKRRTWAYVQCYLLQEFIESNIDQYEMNKKRCFKNRWLMKQLQVTKGRDTKIKTKMYPKKAVLHLQTLFISVAYIAAFQELMKECNSSNIDFKSLKSACVVWKQ